MSVRAEYDANVLISGLVFAEPPDKCLDAVETGEVECVARSTILLAAADRLSGEFHHRGRQLGVESAWLARHTLVAAPPRRLSGVVRDPDDEIVNERALIRQARFVVTGEMDLLSPGGYRNVLIPRRPELLRRLP